MTIKIINESTPVSKTELRDIAKNQFGDLVKAAVDIEQEQMALGGELHADEEAVLIEQGSQQKDVWGINLYPTKPKEEWIEFDSMINVRPSQGNRSRGVEDKLIRDKITSIVQKLIPE